MARQNMPIAKSAINSHDGKMSYVVIRNPVNPFPLTTLTVEPSVADLNNPALTFTATLVKNNANHAIVKLVAINPPGGAVNPIDGLLSITLVDLAPAIPLVLPVTEAPVDYIDDPAGP